MFKVAGIGELLWDVFPSGRRLGGAPTNFCYHAQQLGAKGIPVSAVGADALGAEIRAVLQSLGVDDSLVAEDSKHPTGTVQVTLDAAGKPTFEICEGVAWDWVPVTPALTALAREADAVCFGSLAQRHSVSRGAIHHFLETMRPEALTIFDVNLRQSFYSKEIIEQSLHRSNVLKLSDDELPVMAKLFDLSGSIAKQLAVLRERFELRLVAYTRGPEGSLLVTANESDDHPGNPGKAVDTVGAGDSFTAALCMGLLKKKPLAEINRHANRVAQYVCLHTGATPVLPDELRGDKP
jgi:fructokinase